MKKKGKNIMLLLGIALTSLAWSSHEFYVSLTEIRYNTESARLEISIRMFPDDLDRAILHTYGIPTHLATELEDPEDDTLLIRYLQQHFSIRCEGDPVVLNYLGKEPEADAVWCYLESDPLEKPEMLEVRNTLLTDEFEDQVNIIQVYYLDWNKGALLNRSIPTTRLTLGE
jgi:hypothetical protein